jgi:hypothetical protein
MEGWEANATVNGVERDPGDTTTRSIPHLLRVSTNTEDQSEFVFARLIPFIFINR